MFRRCLSNASARPGRPPRRGLEGRPGTRAAAPRRRVRRCCSTASRPTAIRAVAPFPRTRPAIFFIGRHEERKGLGGPARGDAATRARRRAAGSPATAPTPPASRPRTADDPRIAWLGRISEGDKLARLRGASVFCAPSLHGESFGVVLVEAMAAGTPVVASALDGYRNVATDGVDAVLVPPGDPDALAAALEPRDRRPGRSRRAWSRPAARPGRRAGDVEVGGGLHRDLPRPSSPAS